MALTLIAVCSVLAHVLLPKAFNSEKEACFVDITSYRNVDGLAVLWHQGALLHQGDAVLMFTITNDSFPKRLISDSHLETSEEIFHLQPVLFLGFFNAYFSYESDFCWEKQKWCVSPNLVTVCKSSGWLCLKTL